MLLKGNVAIDIGDDDLVYLTYSEGYRRGGSNAVPLDGFFAEDPRWQLYVADTVDELRDRHQGHAGRVALRPLGVPGRLGRPAAQHGDAELGLLRRAERRRSANQRASSCSSPATSASSMTYGFGWAYIDAKLTADFVVAGRHADPGGRRDAAGRAGEHAECLARLAHRRVRGQGVHRARGRLLPVGDPQRDRHVAVFNVDLDSFQIWGTAFTLAADQWNASLWVKNIFNEEGVTGAFTELYMGTAPASRLFRQRREGPDLAAADDRPVVQLLVLTAYGPAASRRPEFLPHD